MINKKKNTNKDRISCFTQQNKLEIKDTKEYLKSIENTVLMDLKRSEYRVLNTRRSIMFRLKFKNRMINIIKGCLDRWESIRKIIDYLRKCNIKSNNKYFFDNFKEYLLKEEFFNNYRKQDFFFNLEEIKQLSLSLKYPDLKTALDCEKTKGQIFNYLDEEKVNNNNNQISLNIVGKNIEDKEINVTNKEIENNNG